MSLRRAWARLAAFTRKDALDADFDEEALSHIALAVEEYVQRGVPPAEAERLARLTFGRVEASKDAHRDSRGLPWLDAFLYDLRFAVRGLRRDRAFTAAAVFMLALALGLNATVFTVMDAMLYRGYPLVRDNERLLYLQERFASGVCCVSYPDFEEWRSQARAFAGMAFVGERPISLRDGDGRPIDTGAFTVSTNLFQLLGVAPMLGRDFTRADAAEGASPVVILNHRFWASRFGERREAIGAAVHIDGQPATIIGVMPERFDFPTQESVWMPLAGDAALRERGVAHGYIAVGRLRDGATEDEARAELETIGRRLATAYPAANRGIEPVTHRYSEMVSGPDAPMIWRSLWAAAWFVLLIACANLTNLTLVRTMGRWREFSTRIALGAGHGRMIRQALMEQVLLTGAAAVLAWWLSVWSVHRWAAATASIYQILDYSVNAGSLAYLAAIAVATAILCALAPIVRIVQLGAGGALKGDSRGVTRGLRGKHLSAALVSLQMALAIVLLCGAGVLTRSFLTIVRADSGVADPDRILVGLLQLPSDTYPDAASRGRFLERVEAQLRNISGIEAATIASGIPVGGGFGFPRAFEIEGRPVAADGSERVELLNVGSAYFDVVGRPPIVGRTFTDLDRMASTPVALVNQSFAARFWTDGKALGRRVRSLNGRVAGEWRTVVGVVPNIMQGDPLRQQFKPLIYLPLPQAAMGRRAYFLARTSVPAAQQAPQAVRATLRTLDRDVLLSNVDTLEETFAFQRDFMDPEHSELGKHAAAAPVFAGIALLLAAIGLSAVIAHSVSQRAKEIGVRMAIGAAAVDVRRMIFREGMLPVAIGLAAGLAGSLAVNRILQSQLVGVSPYDPATFTGAPLILLAVAWLSCRSPARRAMRVDPVVALRQE